MIIRYFAVNRYIFLCRWDCVANPTYKHYIGVIRWRKSIKNNLITLCTSDLKIMAENSELTQKSGLTVKTVRKIIDF